MSASPLPALLRARMAKLQLSPLDAANKAGISRAGLYLILSDKGNPTLANLDSIRSGWPYPSLFKDLDALS